MSPERGHRSFRQLTRKPLTVATSHSVHGLRTIVSVSVRGLSLLNGLGNCRAFLIGVGRNRNLGGNRIPCVIRKSFLCIGRVAPLVR